MLVCRTVGLSPLLNLIKRMFTLRTIEREGGGGVRAKWQNFGTRIPLVWVRCQIKLFILVFYLKNLFQMLLAPLCPRVTRSSARSRRGARFSFRLFEELGSMPAQANWVRFRLLLKAIGLQSLSMKICMLQSPLLSARNGKPWSAFR